METTRAEPDSWAPGAWASLVLAVVGALLLVGASAPGVRDAETGPVLLIIVGGVLLVWAVIVGGVILGHLVRAMLRRAPAWQEAAILAATAAVVGGLWWCLPLIGAGSASA